MPRPTRRSLPTLALLLVLVATLAPAVAYAATDTDAEAGSLAAIDRERAARGLAPLRRVAELTAVARRHSVRMADSGSLHHNPRLGSEVSGWRMLGENVGRGPDAGTVHDSFMASRSHRDNTLSASFVEVGVGVERRGDVVWVTQVFRTPSGSAPAEPAPAEPAPAEPTPADAPADRAAAGPAPTEAAPDEPAPTAAGTTPSTPAETLAEAPITVASASTIVPAAAPAPDLLVTMLAAIDGRP